MTPDQLQSLRRGDRVACVDGKKTFTARVIRRRENGHDILTRAEGTTTARWYCGETGFQIRGGGLDRTAWIEGKASP